MGEKVAVIGPSGSGKTTLLNLVAGILVPQQGRVHCAGVEVSAMGDRDRRDFRISTIGFVFQDFQLIEYLDVLDNILHPYRITNALRLTGMVKSRAVELAMSCHKAKGNALPSAGHCCHRRNSSWPTRPQATWIHATRGRSWSCCSMRLPPMAPACWQSLTIMSCFHGLTGLWTSATLGRHHDKQFLHRVAIHNLQQGSYGYAHRGCAIGTAVING